MVFCAYKMKANYWNHREQYNNYSKCNKYYSKYLLLDSQLTGGSCWWHQLQMGIKVIVWIHHWGGWTGIAVLKRQRCGRIISLVQTHCWLFIIQCEQWHEQAKIYTVCTLQCFDFLFDKPSVLMTNRMMNFNIADRIYSLFHSDDVSTHNTYITVPSAFFQEESRK